MKIRIGAIITIKHLDDNKQRNVHPFLIIRITNKNIYAVQCTSVKIGDDESYFSREGIPYYPFQFSNFDYETHVRLNQFEIIQTNNIKKTLIMSKRKEFEEICQKLMSIKWIDGERLSKNEIIKHIKFGLKNYGMVHDYEV